MKKTRMKTIHFSYASARSASLANAAKKMIAPVNALKQRRKSKMKLMMKNKKITKTTKIAELLEGNPSAAEVLFEAGMGCVGCAMAAGETIEQGCLAHGMSKKDVDELVKKLNK